MRKGTVANLHLGAALAFVPAFGIDTLTVAVGVGARQHGAADRLRTALTFAAFEAVMPVIGAAIGSGVGALAGRVAVWAGAGLLVFLGAREVREGWSELHEDEDEEDDDDGDGDGETTDRAAAAVGRGGLWALLAAGLSVSVDELGAGLAAGAVGIPLRLLVPLLAAQALVMTLLGMALAARLRALAGRYGELLAGLALVTLGIVVATGKL